MTKTQKPMLCVVGRRESNSRQCEHHKYGNLGFQVRSKWMYHKANTSSRYALARARHHIQRIEQSEFNSHENTARHASLSFRVTFSLVKWTGDGTFSLWSCDFLIIQRLTAIKCSKQPKFDFVILNASAWRMRIDEEKRCRARCVRSVASTNSIHFRKTNQKN